MPFWALGSDSDPLRPPWPRILIACGRQTIAYSIAIRHQAKGATFTVQCQSPRIAPAFFDLVIPPAHDELEGPNVFSIQGSPNRVSPEQLETGRRETASLFEGLPRPLVAVMLGGRSKHYRFSYDDIVVIGRQLRTLRDEGFGLFITPSRRTPPESLFVLNDQLAGPGVTIWDGEGPNPYFGMLAAADYILVTEDSTNMITEAATTGRPIYLLSLKGGSSKFDRLHTQLIDDGRVRRFDGELQPYSYEPLRETERAAAEIRRLALGQASH